MSKAKRPKIIDVLGKSRSPNSRMSDENLRLLHLLAFMTLIGADQELRRRDLAKGEQMFLHIAKPSSS